MRPGIGIRVLLRRKGLPPLELASWFTSEKNLERAKQYCADAAQEEAGSVVLQVRGDSTDWHDFRY